jgi:hypothetical protein
MPSTRLRRLLITQGALLLVGWFAVLACQAAAQRSPVAERTGNQAAAVDDLHNATPAALAEAVSVVAAFLAFAWAGKFRAEINRSLNATEIVVPKEARAWEAA